MNKLTILGRLTKDPEVRKTQSDITVCSFDIAVDRKGKDKVTDFFPCVAWKERGESIGKYFKKGQRILLTGSIQTRSWEKDGVKKERTEIVVDEFDFIEKNEKAEEPKDSTDLPPWLK